MTHIMLDLETWGKRPGCDLRSIGAVVFDPIEGTIADAVHYTDLETLIGGTGSGTFYVATENPEITDEYKLAAGEYSFDDNTGRYFKYPLKRDPKTVEWWNYQTQEAQAAFVNPVDLWKACYSFANWIWSRSLPTERFEKWKPYEHVKIWANGPQFDVPILEVAYHAVQLPTPWHYRAPRDFRTITEAAGMSRDDFCNYGEAHNALDDAIAQAMTVCEAYKRLGLQK